ncbi:hypothetical protein FM106_19815 [Brachybacterium faecium]|nr:hypothetical protein FM106_19815 [Brachybacterium faecium]
MHSFEPHLCVFYQCLYVMLRSIYLVYQTTFINNRKFKQLV